VTLLIAVISKNYQPAPISSQLRVWILHQSTAELPGFNVWPKKPGPKIFSYDAGRMSL